MIQFLKKITLFLGYFFVTMMVATAFVDSELAGRLAVQAMVRMVGVYILSEISWRVRKQKALLKIDIFIGLFATLVFGVLVGGGMDSISSNLMLGLWAASWLFLYNFYILDRFWGIKRSK